MEVGSEEFWKCFELATQIVLIEDRKLLEELAKT